MSIPRNSLLPGCAPRLPRLGPLAVGMIVLVQASVAPAEAGRPIEEIVVTSEFRQSTVDRTPAAVSVVSPDAMKGRALNHLEEILDRIPNVNLAGGSSRARFYQIRGIGERGQYEEPLNASVGLLIDGVDFSGIGSGAVLFDAAQIEVLRGPQGTLYGANALAGLMQVRTHEPTDTFEAGITLDAANYAGRGVGAVVSGPLVDSLSGRLAVRKYTDDGFYHNGYLDRSDTNGHDEFSARGKLALAVSDRLDLGLAAGYVDVDNGYDAFSLDNDRTTRSDEPGMDTQETAYASARAAWAPNEAVVMEGTLGYAESNLDYGYDEDWTFVGFHPNSYSSTDRYQRDRSTTTVDVRALSGDRGRFWRDSTDWVVGLYTLQQTVDLTRTYTFFPAPFTSRYEIDRIAAYGELSSALGERWRLTLGLRGEQHRADYRDSEGVRFEPEDDLWGGRVVLEWDVTRSTMAYAGITRGYKAGGFNASNSLAPDLREYDPETLWNYEVGLKGRWLDERLTGRFALFTMQRRDVQAGTSLLLDRPDGSTEFVALTSNAAEGINSGFEMELTWQVAGALTLFGNLGLLHTEFRDFVNTAGEDLDGEPQAHAPDYQFYVGADYRPETGFFAHLELEGRDSFYYSDSRRFSDRPQDLRSDPYTLVNAALGYARARWELRLWGQNLTDEDYRIRGYYFPNDPRDDYSERGWFQLGEPRRYGITLNLRI